MFYVYMLVELVGVEHTSWINLILMVADLLSG